jgi:hypothetical protein
LIAGLIAGLETFKMILQISKNKNLPKLLLMLEITKYIKIPNSTGKKNNGAKKIISLMNSSIIRN